MQCRRLFENKKGVVMKGKTVVIALLGILFTISVSQRASAQCSTALQVVATHSPHIRIYSETGKYLGEIQGELALRQRALDCNESYGLIKVQLTDRRVVWMLRKEASPLHDAVCPMNRSVLPPSYRFAGTSGAGPQC
jgi:hypothetical protein